MSKRNQFKVPVSISNTTSSSTDSFKTPQVRQRKISSSSSDQSSICSNSYIQSSSKADSQHQLDLKYNDYLRARLTNKLLKKKMKESKDLLNEQSIQLAMITKELTDLKCQLEIQKENSSYSKTIKWKIHENSIIAKKVLEDENIKMNQNLKASLILNQTNALILNSIESFKNSILSTFWHKFIIHEGASLDSKQVLKSVVQCGGDIFPIQYELDGENATFIARNCSKAIENLCARNLVLKYAEGKPPAVLSIHVNKGVPNQTTLNIQDVITQVIKKRYTKETGVLNLENFVDDPDLRNKVFCSISQHKVLMFVLSLANELNVRCLQLNNNEISKIDGLEVMTYIWTFKLLHSIDLRNNLIADISELNLLQKFNITELWLDENPICNAYENYEYVSNVKKVCPNIKILDGEELCKNGIPISRKNFLIKYSSINLVDQFLEHYFKLYDTNRESLIDLYHSEALLSLTSSLIPNQITSTTEKLDKFQRINRNLLNNKDSKKYEKFLYHSREDIVKILCKLSASEHDLYSFTVDVLYHVDKTTVISVTGVFREGSDKEKYDSRNLLNFSRTFVILAAADGEYHIVNEQLFISNATTSQVKLAFQNHNEIKPKTFTDEEQSCLIETIVKICETDVEIAKRLLEITNWDLKSSIKIFVDQSIQQLMTSSSPPTSSDSNPSWQICNHIPNQPVGFSNSFPDPFIAAPRPPIGITIPPIGIANSPFGITNPPIEIPYTSSEIIQNTHVEFSNPFPHPTVADPHPPIGIANAPIENPYPPSGIPYPSLEISNSSYGVPNPNDGNINSSLGFPNPFYLSPQSSQITSTTNEFVSGLLEDDVLNKNQNIIENNSEKSQIVPVSVKEMICDVCYFYSNHRKDCPKHPENLEKSLESNTNTSIVQMYSFIKKLEIESTPNKFPIKNVPQEAQKKNNSRRKRIKCTKCQKRHFSTTICTNILNLVSPSTNSNNIININKYGEEINCGKDKKLDEVSTKMSYNTDSSNPLEKFIKIKSDSSSKAFQRNSENTDSTKTNSKNTDLHKKNQNVLNLNNGNIEKALKGSSETTESSEAEKLSTTEEQKSESSSHITFEKSTKTDLKIETNSSNTRLVTKNQIDLNLKSNNGNKEKTVQSNSETIEITKTEKLLKTEVDANQKIESSFKTERNSNNIGNNLKLLCWYCNKPNHDVFECRSRKRHIREGIFDFEKFFETLKTKSAVTNTTTADVQNITEATLKCSSEIIESIKIEKIEDESEKQKSEKNNSTKTALETETNSNNTGKNLQPLCWYCNEANHDVLECQKRKRDIENRVFDFDKFFETLKTKTEVPNTEKALESSSSTGNQVLKCTNCKKEGHTKESVECISQPSKTDKKLHPICFYCNKKRHKLLNCEKRKVDILDGIFDDDKFLKSLQKFEAENSFKISGVTQKKILLCDFCSSEGHTQSLCNKLNGIVTENLKQLGTLDPFHMNSSGTIVKQCGYCGKLGHSKYSCKIIRAEIMVIATENVNSETLQRMLDTNTCSYCKQNGHIKRQCVNFKKKLLKHIQRMALVNIPRLDY
ncbi:uncharacterized protein LOC123292704 [Chrysoperla carnea]|uniref:uncharacterized protein LOC123292704 n=1 Tax=Chrysoperla carnea TaxID=189513 RepID=UPI001D0649A3|nr:uncharacterized protein LOC123292704 [Chrysoperla carnea]